MTKLQAQCIKWSPVPSDVPADFFYIKRIELYVEKRKCIDSVSLRTSMESNPFWEFHLVLSFFTTDSELPIATNVTSNFPNWNVCKKWKLPFLSKIFSLLLWNNLNKTFSFVNNTCNISIHCVGGWKPGCVYVEAINSCNILVFLKIYFNLIYSRLRTVLPWMGILKSKVLSRIHHD